MTDPAGRPEPPRPTSAAAGTPRWVKVMGVITLVVVVVLVALFLTGGPGEAGHGPGQHSMPVSGTEPAQPRL